MGRSTDLTGMRFGKLVVVEQTQEKEDRYYTWRCRCDCGGEVIVNTKRLTRGTITDCGCEPRNPNLRGQLPMELSGERFGKLTVLHRLPNRENGRTAWLCQCDCGNQCEVTTHSLRRGHTKSCGCLSIELNHGGANDLTGKVIGRLTPLYPTAQRTKKGSIIWHCRCECGEEVDLSEDNLVHGSYKSCGCYVKELKENIYKQLTFVDNTCVELLAYRKSRADNTSGFRGVTKAPRDKWKAGIGLQGKHYHIGTFSSFEDAVKARLRVEELLHDGFVEAYRAWCEKAEADPSWAEHNPFYFNVVKNGCEFSVDTTFGTKTVSTP